MCSDRRVKSFFDQHRAARWAQQERVHVYLRADTEALAGAVHRYQQRLLDDRLAEQHGLGLQPVESLHATVQDLGVHLPALADGTVAALAERLMDDLHPVVPFDLYAGPPQVSRSAAELWISPEADERWRELVGTIRSAAYAVLGDGVLPAIGTNGTPHISLGYGVGDGDSGVLTSALKEVRVEMAEVPVEQVELASVTQHPDAGCYTWETLAVLPLGGTTRRGP